MSRIHVSVAGLCLALLLAAVPSNAQTITQVMSGLDAPRGLAWGPEGGLYVTEAGDGTRTGPCTPVAVGSNCYSETRKITRLYRGRQERVVTGLPSIFNTGRGDIVGPNDISFQGRGTAFVTIGWGGNPTLRSNLGTVGSNVGVLLQVEPSGRWRFDADISDFERVHNPVGVPVDSNPYGVLAPNGSRTLITTALNRPTSVVVGDDGAIYVSNNGVSVGTGEELRIQP